MVPPRRAAFSSLSTAAAGPVAGLGLSANQHFADLLQADFSPWLCTQIGGLPSAAAAAFIGPSHPEMRPSSGELSVAILIIEVDKDTAADLLIFRVNWGIELSSRPVELTAVGS